ncbi:hypothetical protein [Nostoc sp.]
MSRNPPDDDTLGKQWAMSGDKKQSFYAFLGYPGRIRLFTMCAMSTTG